MQFPRDRLVSSAFVFVAALALAGCDKLPFGLDQSHGAVSTCEEIVKARIASPATYRRASATFSPGAEMDFAMYRMSKEAGYNPYCTDGTCGDTSRMLMYGGVREDLMRKGIRNPTKKQVEAGLEQMYRDGLARLQKVPEAQRKVAFVTVHYDAQNQYGAVMRDAYTCMFAPKREGDNYSPQDTFGTSRDAELILVALGSLEATEF